MTTVAILDADVLFPMVLRDTLLRVAAAGCFRLQWSDRILDEMTRNLVIEQRMAVEQADALKAVMNEAFPDALVTSWTALEKDMPNHPKDRHVAAAAIASGASTIVTSNLKDFSRLPDGLVAISPDTFLLGVFEDQPEGVISALRQQASSYRRPPATIGELIEWIGRVAPRFAAAVRASSP